MFCESWTPILFSFPQWRWVTCICRIQNVVDITITYHCQKMWEKCINIKVFNSAAIAALKNKKFMDALLECHSTLLFCMSGKSTVVLSWSPGLSLQTSPHAAHDVSQSTLCVWVVQFAFYGALTSFWFYLVSNNLKLKKENDVTAQERSKPDRTADTDSFTNTQVSFYTVLLGSISESQQWFNDLVTWLQNLNLW